MHGELPDAYVTRVAKEKVAFAQKILHMRGWPIRPILAADTTVVIDGCILGKPLDEAAAAAMLQQLSGRTHRVLTAVALCHNEKIWHATQISEVKFAHLTEEIIAAYCATEEPYDKAGGYGIQGKAATFIEHISGSHSGIMGLPLYETAQLLLEAGLS